MKKLTSLISLVILFVHAQAQNGSNYKYLSNFVQPPPNAAALGKYVDYPVGYYTGTPEISIPVYEINDDVAKIPISISYHASGIRVSEIASWVGSGWSLNATGMIIRTIKGAPDEGSIVSGGYGPTPRGYYSHNGLTQLALLNHPDANGVIPPPSSNDMTNATIPDISGAYGDGEPDLFFFNFNGYSGKFVFDENRTPRILSEQDLKITVDYSSVGFSSWIITTPDGTKYYFGENNQHEVATVLSSTTATDVNSTLPSSWYLTRIVYPDPNQTVSFQYTPEKYYYYDLGQETELYEGDDPTACSSPYPPNNIFKTTVDGLRLTSITTKNYKVYFNAATSARQDLGSVSNAPNPYALDNIKICNSNGQCIRQFVFSYNYFISTTNSGITGMHTSFMYGDPVTDTKRLKLLSLTEKSGEGSISKPPYEFTYFESLQLPRRMSFDQDHWGYSNNSPGNANSKFMPQVSHGFCSSPYGQFANRNSKWPDMQSFTISTIKNPLGGTTSFEYGSHSSSQASIIGGLRIQKITVTDNLGNSQVRVFQYDYGNLYNQPQYLYIPNNEYYLTGFGYTSYQGYNTGAPILNFLKQSQSIVPLQDFNGNHIGYSYVKEIYGLNGENGYKIYRFNAGTTSGLSSRLNMSNYTAFTTIYIPQTGQYNSGIYGNGHFNDILPENLQYYSGYDAQNYFPIAPGQIDLKRGKLLKEETYNSSNDLLQSVDNQYEEVYHENYWIRGFKAHRILHTDSYGNTTYRDALTYYKLHTGVSRLKTSVITETSNGQTIVTTKSYDYESPYHTMMTGQKITNSKGDEIVKKTFYSFDYSNSATPDNVFEKMKNANILVPISERLWIRGKLASGSITEYKDFAQTYSDLIIKPYKTHALEIISPLTSVQAAENINYTSQFTTLIPNSYYKEKANYNYNSSGKLIEQLRLNDIKYAYIWGYNNSYPVAEIIGASYNSVIATPGLNLNVINTPSDDAAMRTELNKIRANFSSAQVTTYTYKPLVGITSATDINGRTTYYIYDAFGRLALIKDKDGNVVKRFCYNYQGEPGDCSLFANAAINTNYYSQNCGSQTPVAYSVSVPQGTFYASTQTSADQQAQQYAQNIANANGTCSANMTQVTGHSYISGPAYNVNFTNTATNTTYSMYLAPYSNGSVTLPIGTYNVSFAPGGPPSYTYFSVNSYSTYSYTPTFYNITMSGYDYIQIGY